MSREQSEVLSIVTSEMDKRENKFLKWLLLGLLATVATIAAAAFLLGFKIQATLNQVNAIATLQDVMRVETKARVGDWTAWRKSVDDGNLRSAGDRFTSGDFDVAAAMFNMGNPPVMLPYTREIHLRTRQP
jgi:hypothetical protein